MFQHDLLYKELSYKITGLCFEAHNDLGRFLRERQYSDKLEEILKRENIPFFREVLLDEITDSTVQGNRIDFIIENTIIIDLKAKKFITKDDYYQMQRYLQCSNLQLGLIVNFRDTYLKPKRVINSKYTVSPH
jgi:GxxExxY protein